MLMTLTTFKTLQGIPLSLTTMMITMSLMTLGLHIGQMDQSTRMKDTNMSLMTQDPRKIRNQHKEFKV